MEREQRNFPIERMVKLFRVSRSGYYAFIQRKPKAREKEKEKIADKIKEAYQKSRATYGSPRIHYTLNKQGISCSRKRVAKLMQKMGISAIMRKSWKRTTRPGKRKAAPNLVQQEFQVGVPNRVWVSDITYIKTKERVLTV